MGVIEYWFSEEIVKGKKASERAISPENIVKEYKTYTTVKEAQEEAYATITAATKAVVGVAAGTALVVTAGLVVGEVVVGITIPSITPEIASWMANTVRNITIRTAKTAEVVSQVVYQAGNAIQRVYSNVPYFGGLKPSVR